MPNKDRCHLCRIDLPIPFAQRAHFLRTTVHAMQQTFAPMKNALSGHLRMAGDLPIGMVEMPRFHCKKTRYCAQAQADDATVPVRKAIEPQGERSLFGWVRGSANHMTQGDCLYQFWNTCGNLSMKLTLIATMCTIIGMKTMIGTVVSTLVPIHED
jgi:hypothetical protein